MGKRGGGSFRRSDASRAVSAAREGGLEPAVMEITIAKDGGAVIRVYGRGTITAPDASTPPEGTQREVMSAKEWDEEFAKLDAKKEEKKAAKKT